MFLEFYQFTCFSFDNIEYRKQMTPLRAFLMALILTLGYSSYRLDFDWTLNVLSTGADYGYVTWNSKIIAKLEELVSKNTLHHTKVNVNFSEGQNQLSFFFVGIKGKLMIGNVAITKLSTTINLIINGDFAIPSLDSNQTKKTYTSNIVGWYGSQIEITSTSKLGSKSTQAVLLTASNNDINQKVSFGRVSKYSFISSLNSDLQSMANNIIQQNLQTYSQNISRPSTGTISNYSTSSNPTGSVNDVQALMEPFYSINSTSSLADIASQVYNQLSLLKEQTLDTNITVPTLNISVPYPAVTNSP